MHFYFKAFYLGLQNSKNSLHILLSQKLRLRDVHKDGQIHNIMLNFLSYITKLSIFWDISKPSFLR